MEQKNIPLEQEIPKYLERIPKEYLKVEFERYA